MQRGFWFLGEDGFQPPAQLERIKAAQIPPRKRLRVPNSGLFYFSSFVFQAFSRIRALLDFVKVSTA